MSEKPDDNLYISLGKVILQRRKDLGLSQEQLAKRSNVDRAFLSAVERGKRQPSFGTVSKVASGLDIRYSQLIRLCESALEMMSNATSQPSITQSSVN
ncbi:MAG: helix-turn-helix transcriptional regulator [Cyanobacteria bacterium SZAS TMP-1]|nr:helix-turn-helix transcriptional regulator [Cyanobacteria bacterium SZAS TMP-1]